MKIRVMPGADANRRLNLAEVGKAQGRTIGRDFEPNPGKLAVRERVQEKLVCSVGDRPIRVTVRSLVAWIAERREIEFLMPIDKAIFRMVSKTSGRNESERRFGLEVLGPEKAELSSGE